jgi:23S rRNA (cytidine1920-2'-O)/16S rRNA (cytidine1409-2'-O)-methyltransferase
MKKKNCILLDKLLSDGWFETEREALPWILARRVLANDRVCLSLKERIPADAAIRVKEYYKKRYVNKGGLKLEKALRDFGLDVDGMVALDCGASTGGFTDCLLRHGAGLVYAVDAGFGQLAGKLRNDERVVNMERTNLSDAALLKLDPKPGIVTLDLSYLSLKKAVPESFRILGDNGVAVCLVKPIFETDDPEIRRSGQVNDPDIFRNVLVGLASHFMDSGLRILGVTNSPVTGNRGTIEFFLCLGHGESGGKSIHHRLAEHIDRAVRAAADVAAFRKNEVGVAGSAPAR